MRLIDADAAADCLQRTAQDHRSVGMHTSAAWHDTMASLLNNERCFPTVDAAPVVHARWDDTNCTACGESYMDYADGWSFPRYYKNKLYTPDYCPHCNAKMDAKEAKHGQKS